MSELTSMFAWEMPQTPSIELFLKGCKLLLLDVHYNESILGFKRDLPETLNNAT
jgi:hypothetical protein